MSTSNEELRDAYLRRQIGLLQLSDPIAARLLRILNGTEDELRKTIEQYVEVLATVNLYSKRGKSLIERLERAILKVRGSAMDELAKALVRELEGIAIEEAKAVGTAIRTALVVEVGLNTPSNRRLRIIAREVQPRGAALQRWIDGLKAQEARIITAEVAAGLANGDNTNAIVRRIIGTKEFRGADGQTQRVRTNVDALVRTSVMEVAAQVRTALVAENSNLFSEEQLVATLDSRTTPLCRSLDGKRFPPGTGPRPPLHWRCRTVRVPVFDGGVIGTRPAKPVTEKLLRREFDQANTTLSWSKWRQRRVRELTGPVAASVTYQEWLSRQSAAFQDDLLGPTRGALFRKGHLTLDKFVNYNTGREWTLAELARRELEAFREAGLDVRRFR